MLLPEAHFSRTRLHGCNGERVDAAFLTGRRRPGEVGSGSSGQGGAGAISLVASCSVPACLLRVRHLGYQPMMGQPVLDSVGQCWSLEKCERPSTLAVMLLPRYVHNAPISSHKTSQHGISPSTCDLHSLRQAHCMMFKLSPLTMFPTVYAALSLPRLVAGGPHQIPATAPCF
jgi:hypothetical protein